MRRSRLLPSIALSLSIALAAPRLAGASAASFGLFQHGARAIGQAGAFAARASDPSAIFYNPAAIAKLQGFQLAAGLDFENPTDRFESSAGSFEARHVIQFPPHVYAAWRPGSGAVALGIGIDAPFWYDENWDPALFPGRYLTRRFQLQVGEAHPVIAFNLSNSFSIGGGVRYLYGAEKQGENKLVTVLPATGPATPVEVMRDADANVDGLGWDVAVHYARPAWGWGAVYRSSIKLSGNGNVGYEPRDVPVGVPGLGAALASRFTSGSAHLSFQLPDQLSGGIWIAPYPELRLELDGDFQRWSDLPDTAVTFSPDAFGFGPEVKLRNWNDTFSLRLGIEGDVTSALTLFGGIGFEPSPVRNVEPGFPRGDATVYAAGFSYNFPQLSFDLAYSLHEAKSLDAPHQDPLAPGLTGRYTSRESVWAASARWRF
jgi:long-chain fatty acid transport protein